MGISAGKQLASTGAMRCLIPETFAEVLRAAAAASAAEKIAVADYRAAMLASAVLGDDDDEEATDGMDASTA
jgi:hypothetical protein